MPLWLKPTYIVIAVLVALLGVQTWRLTSAHSDTAQAQLQMAQLTASVASARAEGEAEGSRRQKAAQDAKDAAHAAIVAGLEADKVQLQKHYADTYSMLQKFAAEPKWQCLNEPLPETVLHEFRR